MGRDWAPLAPLVGAIEEVLLGKGGGGGGGVRFVRFPFIWYFVFGKRNK